MRSLPDIRLSPKVGFLLGVFAVCAGGDFFVVIDQENYDLFEAASSLQLILKEHTGRCLSLYWNRVYCCIMCVLYSCDRVMK